jgi:nitrite reductase/ring-hydroxylating ferredoxin subunit
LTSPIHDSTRSDRQLTRRGALAIGAVGLSAGTLAACSQAKSPGGSTGGSGSSGGPLAKLSDIKVGEAIAATGPDGAKIIISRPTQTTVAAFSAICTHQGCAVVPAGKELDCPCHHSSYDATTGAVLAGPAPLPLPSVKVKLSGDEILPG